MSMRANRLYDPCANLTSVRFDAYRCDPVRINKVSQNLLTNSFRCVNLRIEHRDSAQYSDANYLKEAVKAISQFSKSLNCLT